MSKSRSRQSAQQGFQDEEARLRAIIEHVADGIIIIDRRGLIRFVNPAAATLLGRPAEALLGEEFGFPLVADGTVEIEIVTRRDLPVVAELRSVDMAWEGAPALLVSLRDITHRREAEERKRRLDAEQAARVRAELEERRSRFLADASRVLDSSLQVDGALHRLVRLLVSPQSAIGDGSAAPHPPLGDLGVIDLLEKDGSIRRVALAHRDPQMERAARPLKDLYSPSTTGPYLGHSVIDTGRPLLVPEITEEFVIGSTRGAEHAALVRSLGIRSVMAVPIAARGETLGAIILCAGRSLGDAELLLSMDIAQRAALAVSNARLYEQAQGANRAKSDFLAVMSHELRTPLNAIMGYADLMAAGVSGPLSGLQSEHLERISGSARHLLQIVEEILTYARVEAGKEDVSLTPVDLRDLLDEVASMIRPLVEKRNLQLVVNLQPEPPEIETDPGKLRQILLNLLSNAVKFTDHGFIELVASWDADWSIIQVRDSGSGIPEPHLERIFEPFWQVEQSVRRTAGGTGLGLSVARRLAQLLAAQLEVESELGTGSIFTLRLPATHVRRSESGEGAVAAGRNPSQMSGYKALARRFRKANGDRPETVNPGGDREERHQGPEWSVRWGRVREGEGRPRAAPGSAAALVDCRPSLRRPAVRRRRGGRRRVVPGVRGRLPYCRADRAPRPAAGD